MASHERAGMSWWLCGRVSPRRLAVPCLSLLWARCAVPPPFGSLLPSPLCASSKEDSQGLYSPVPPLRDPGAYCLVREMKHRPAIQVCYQRHDKWSVIHARALWVPVVKGLCSIRTSHSNQCLGKLYNLIPVMYSVIEILPCHQHTKNHSLSLFVNQLFGPQDIPSCGNSVPTVIGDWK